MIAALAAPARAPGVAAAEPLLLAFWQTGSCPAALEDAACSAGLDLAVFSSKDRLATMLETRRARAVLVDLDSRLAPAVCWEVRRDPARFGTPIIGVTRAATDLTFAELFLAGGDDLVERAGLGQLVSRLRALPPAPLVRANARGKVVVAGEDPQKRALSARVLLHAGFDVLFASDRDELLAAFGAGEPLLVVADGSPGSWAVGVLGECRARGSKTPFILALPPRMWAAARASLAAFGAFAFHDSFAPAGDLLFLANDLLCAAKVELRAAPRLLHGTRVWFRGAGEHDDHLGYTYTVSDGGLFVRTLAPLTPGSRVWMELCPPRESRRVRLCASVAWTRPFGTGGTVTAPPGMGLRIDGGLPGCLERYRGGCARLQADLGYTP